VRRLAAALACVLLTGCVYSFEPFHTKDALVASPLPAGKWRPLGNDGTPATDETWEFAADRIVIHDNRGEWRALEAKFFRAGGASFVETSPRDLAGESPSDSYWSLHRVPFHLLTRIEVSADRVVARTLIAGKPFQEAARDTPLARNLVRRGDYAWFVFDATPADWKAFLEKHARNDALYSKEMVFARLK
jgi:hypothetical protein